MIEQDISRGGQADASIKPYPYADPKTYEFLQTVVRDGTQRILPKYMKPEWWVRNKNITGLYFSCNISEQELADMYGVTKQNIDRIIGNTLRCFWESSIGYDQMEFPIASLSTENPATRHRLNGFSGKNQMRFESLISSGAVDLEVAGQFRLSLERTRATMRSMGKTDQITTSTVTNRKALSQLESLPLEDYERRQKTIDSFSRAFYARNRYLFANLSQVAILLEMKIPRGRYAKMDNFAYELKKKGIPVGCFRQDKSKREFFIWREDFERIKSNLPSATNPSETSGS